MVEYTPMKFIKTKLIIFYLIIIQAVIFPLAAYGGYYAEQETTPKWTTDAGIQDNFILSKLSALEFWSYIRFTYHFISAFNLVFGLYLMISIWVPSESRYGWLKW